MRFTKKTKKTGQPIYDGISRFAAKENRRILLRYSFLYIVYLLVLFILLFAVIRISDDMLTKKTVRIAEETIRTGVNELEITFDAYDQTATVLFSAPEMELAAVSISDANYSVNQAHQFYQNIVQTIENQPTCGLFIKNGTLFVTNGVFRTPETYFRDFLHCLEYPAYDAWRDTVWAADTGKFAPALHYRDNNGTVKKSILYTVRSNTTSIRLLYYVVIPTERIEQILIPASGTVTGNLTLSTLYDGQEIVLYESNALPAEACTHTVTYTGSSGLQVRLAIADSVIDAEMQEAWSGYYLLSAAFILIGLFFAMMLAYHNTRPIAVLMNAAAQFDTTGQVDVKAQRLGREYRYLLSVLSNGGAALKSYEKELERHAAETRYWSFVSMLMGEDSDILSEIRGTPYALLLIRPEQTGSDAGSLILPLIRNFLSPFGTDALCALIRHTVVILACETRHDELKTGIAGILGSISGFHYRQVSIHNLDTPAAIRDAYAQATYKLSFSPAGGAYLHEMALASQPAVYSGELETLTQFSFSTVSHLLTSGQITELTGMLDDCIAFFRSGGYAGELLVRYVYESCATALAIVQSKFPDIAAQIRIPDYVSPVHVESLFVSLRESLTEAHARLCAFYEKNTVTQSNEIIAYITENIGNPDLYTKLVTEQFGITEKALQSCVREASGMSFFDFVEKVRMTEARRLVQATNLSVAQIAIQCGYNSSTAFSRAFNRYYGISPLKMRMFAAEQEQA